MFLTLAPSGSFCFADHHGAVFAGAGIGKKQQSGRVTGVCINIRSCVNKCQRTINAN
jgi:hypothetical protein